MVESILQNLGLQENEIKVYLALLSVGNAPASVIGSRVNIPRSTSKYTCLQLAKKGLVIKTVKNNTFLFTAKDPESLYTLLERQRKEIDNKEKDLSLIFSELKKIYNPHSVLPKVTFYEGPENIKKMFADVLKENATIYSALYLEKDDQIESSMRDYLYNVYIPQRKKLQTRSFGLFNDNEATKAYQKLDQAMNRVSLLVPEKLFPFETCYHIYGNKVAFYSYKKDDITGVIIENTHIRNTQFSIFKLAWSYARMLKLNHQYKSVDI